MLKITHSLDKVTGAYAIRCDGETVGDAVRVAAGFEFMGNMRVHFVTGDYRTMKDWKAAVSDTIAAHRDEGNARAAKADAARMAAPVEPDAFAAYGPTVEPVPLLDPDFDAFSIDDIAL